ncbi:MAG: diaminopimelate decarboxylase [Lachnospiraceae bacterium]|nr:diaminopimelate decarboxylase [Lachnospiraceae bacterium]
MEKDREALGLLFDHLDIGEDGVLRIAGQDCAALAARYGTPLYIMDEDRIRERCRSYLGAVRDAFGADGQVLFASKAASFKHIYEIMKEEGMGIDVVSCGEIRTALAAGYPLSKAYFHSNNKTDEDISYAMAHGVGTFVADNEEELYAVEKEAMKRGVTQKVLLRLTPGIDPHTFEAVATGRVDSKFGSAIETGQAEQVVKEALALPHVRLTGFHCHVGSQVFDSGIYLRAADVMLSFIAEMKARLGYEAEELDLGGSLGVRYVKTQPVLDYGSVIRSVGAFVREKCAGLGIRMPRVSFEPGRSIVADSGVTLYTAGTVKRIPGYKNYISVDGGMTDNVRYALYGAPYTVLPATKMTEPRTMKASVVGRCCESGDIIQEDVEMPASIRRGDLVAVLTTGAYNYSMASNYNRIPRPPVVMLKGGTSFEAVRRETLDDLVRLDV